MRDELYLDAVVKQEGSFIALHLILDPIQFMEGADEAASFNFNTYEEAFNFLQLHCLAEFSHA
mgnify:CR=1 FL=1